MEAKGTVKTREELKTYLADTSRGHFAFTEEELRIAQAEISFKAGIEEVVEWVNKHGDLEASYTDDLHVTRSQAEIPLTLWQAKLKEWEVEPS